MSDGERQPCASDMVTRCAAARPGDDAGPATNMLGRYAAAVLAVLALAAAIRPVLAALMAAAELGIR